jgi:hypothetical protein
MIFMQKKVTKKMTQSDKKEDNTGLFIPAGLFLGLGIGFIADQVVGGLFVGLGVGFVGLAIARIFSKK